MERQYREAGGGPGRSRTADQRFRKPLLCPSELRGHDNANYLISVCLGWDVKGLMSWGFAASESLQNCADVRQPGTGPANDVLLDNVKGHIAGERAAGRGYGDVARRCAGGNCRDQESVRNYLE